MLFGRLIEAKQLTILKGISKFFFLLYHLWYVYAFFTYAQVKYPLGFPLIMINILVFFKGISIFIKWYIYIYIYIVEGWTSPLGGIIHLGWRPSRICSIPYRGETPPTFAIVFFFFLRIFFFFFFLKKLN